jgi:hypothetical protein
VQCLMTPVYAPCIPPTPAPANRSHVQENETKHGDTAESHIRAHPTTFLSQFLCLLTRTFLLILRDKVCVFQNILLCNQHSTEPDPTMKNCNETSCLSLIFL